MVGIGGAPTRATTLPEKAEERKRYPVASGVLDYFPDALVAIAHVSWAGNEQHNPGKPVHWDRNKSADEADTCMRHFLQRGTFDTDGKRHTAKAAWRLLALLQKEIEAEGKAAEETNHLTREIALEEIRAIRAASGFSDRCIVYESPAHAIQDVDVVVDDHGHEGFVPAQKVGAKEEKGPKVDPRDDFARHGRYCKSVYHGWQCTRPKGHAGQHAAHYPGGEPVEDLANGIWD